MCEFSTVPGHRVTYNTASVLVPCKVPETNECLAIVVLLVRGKVGEDVGRRVERVTQWNPLGVEVEVQMAPTLVSEPLVVV